MADNKDNGKKPFINYSKGSGVNVRLRGKRISKGRISLFLDYYWGYNKTGNKKISKKTGEEIDEVKTHRKVEYLKLYLIENPRKQEERIANKENLALAQDIRGKRESEIQHSSEGFVAPFKKKINFFDFCENYVQNYQKKDIRMIKNAIKHFKSFLGQSTIFPENIDSNLIKDFRDYLLNEFNGETPSSYFRRFKKILTAATDKKYFVKSPGDGISCKAPNGISKEILMPDEIIELAKTECGNPEVKRAFLFSLNTGLRFVDIEDLKYGHIKNGKIMKNQQKTGGEVIIDLNETAISLLGEIKKPKENVFSLPSFSSSIRTIKNWAKKAGINKNLTWHSARHSFATILVMNNTDLRTVGNLMGHSKLEHTQKYAHLVDELKKKAVDKLPKIDL